MAFYQRWIRGNRTLPLVSRIHENLLIIKFEICMTDRFRDFVLGFKVQFSKLGTLNKIGMCARVLKL